LEAQSQSLHWQSALQIIKTKSALKPELCTHSEPALLKSSQNKYASQVFCQKCQKTIVYNHTKDGLVTWINKFQELVVKKKISPPPNWEGMHLHPDDEDASRYCKRCVHHMEPVQTLSGCRTWHQCSQHSANPPCLYARNGHLPIQANTSKAKQKEATDTAMRLWQDHTTVRTIHFGKISGTTVNNIGRKYKGRTYNEIFEHAPEYVNWAITTAPFDSEASVELKHMAAFFLEARKCQMACQIAADLSSPASSSTTKQPTGKSSFAKPAKAKSKASAKAAHFNLASLDEESEDELM
jgi:hypothetical protein